MGERTRPGCTVRRPAEQSIMPHSLRRRRMYRNVGRSSERPVIRTVLRSCARSALRGAWRTVIPYDGPSLNDICALLSRYIRLANAYDKKWGSAPPESRFVTLCSPEESRRKFEEDLQRCYGQPGNPVETVGPSDQSSRGERGRPACTSQRPAENLGSSPNGALALAAMEPAVSAAAAKKDVIAVPLVRTSSGLLGLDWSAAR